MAYSPGIRVTENGISPGIYIPPYNVGTSVTIVNSNRLTSTYDFGYNIGSKDTWNSIWSSSLFPSLLDQLSPQHIRYPGGAINYWDWNTQTVNSQFPLPNSATLPASEISFYKGLVEPRSISTLWGINMLTSSVPNGTPLLNQQSGALLNITNSYHMPVNKIELGSEFYLLDPPMYSEKYPSGSNYGAEASQWMTTLRTIFPTSKYGVPVVDTKFSSNAPNASRRLSWNTQSITEYIKSSNIPDAFVIHSYPTASQNDYNNIADWVLNAPYAEFENISASIAKIYTFSPQISNSDFWITEYNIIDNSDLNTSESISGTWAHGLYNLTQTFLLMDHPKITLGTFHSTHAGRYFGSIFDSTYVFGPGTSTKFDLSAAGILMGYFGTAYKDSDSFSNITSSLNGLIGKIFRSSTSGDKFILVNLNSGSYLLDLSGILSDKTISSITSSYAKPTLLVNKITGSGKLTISQSFYTSLSTQEMSTYNMQPYEVTYIKCNV
jgi:hypothetical protein